MDFNLKQADFVFPDARENNMVIEKFIGMYLYEPFAMESGESAWIVAATYENIIVFPIEQWGIFFN